MTRGTTPTFTLTFPEDVDFSVASKIVVTFADMGGKVLMNITDVEAYDNIIEVFLTQEESLSLPLSKIQIQANWTYDDLGVEKRACSDIAYISVCKNLLNEVM